MDKSKCIGCENDFYNQRGENHPCWSLEDAKVIKRKKVHVDQVPPWNQKAEDYPGCYHVKRYVFVGKDQTN